MNNEIIKLTANTEKLKARCSKYEQYLHKLRSLLLGAFNNISFPGKYFKLIIYIYYIVIIVLLL